MMSNGSSNRGRTTNFNEIEEEKENILPLRDGRSAQGLSQVLNEDLSQLNCTRLTFERRLLEELEDLDDPLELFMEYINWINHAYPQGGSSKKSGMLDLLERCLMYFRDMETYKNDPRLLKVWLWYIEVFSADSDQDSKEIFIYMLRKRIGNKLALFYEAFAASLFEAGKFKEAHIILKMGVDENARPQNRLLKRLEECEMKLRIMNIEPSNSGPADRQFLESSSNLVLGRGRSSLLTTMQGGSSGNAVLDRDVRLAKYDVFRDEENANDVNAPLRNDGWDLLDSRANRTKENQATSTRITSGSNLGKIDQEGDYQQRQASSEKLPIFKDSLGRSEPVYKLVQVAGKKPEKIDCNFNLIYPTSNEEFCIEEILAISRNVYHKIDNDAVLAQDEAPMIKKRKKSAPLTEKKALLPSSQPPVSHIRDGSQNEPSNHSNQSEDNEKLQVVPSTSILPLRSGQEDDRTDHEKIKKQLQSPRSPTITYFSKSAMEEVYSMFNQHYQEPKAIADRDETTGRFVLDNITQDYTRQNLEDLTEVKRTDADGNTKTGNLYVEAAEKNIVASPHKEAIEAETASDIYGAGRHDFMTPIQERNEKPSETPSEGQNGDSGKDLSEVDGSSPFLTQPQLTTSGNKKSEAHIIEDPLNSKLRAQLLANVKPPLDDYETFYRYNQPLKMSALLKRIHRVSKSENKNPIVDFKKTGDLYCIRAELGEGGYATVYLAESSTGGLKALKVEKPASVWEFYILKQVEKKLKGNGVLRSIINASSLHCFQDESYLVLNYANQGTILDLVNLQKEKSKGPIDELLCMFMTIELMKVVEALHSVGIVHGDLKPDNCMIRFETGSLGPYQADGSEGWDRKGIYLIDFGRSFNMSLFEPGTKFKANWKTDQQDCVEMTKGIPWSYEADYFGLAGIIHSLLFGELIDTIQGPDGRVRLRNSFKRYWKQDIWSSIFDALINSNSFDCFPITSMLVESRLQIEAYLTSHNTDNLRCIIRDLESELTQARRGTRFSR
ncbi:hypothetical protein HG536_0E04780 [Torulaspora globosa]|uniref:Protein kinase domain-containing protein n=1 Tax=Torulaspora globosa TaxID=48254 RepID=A0A7G3ZJ81_9SACH|nr:uncharacterized protein HG536_0E04780 [Torulaspora globosa]QLL33567.1 hypothetical protein HG536_0E04780 [Torulaspora globosa]